MAVGSLSLSFNRHTKTGRGVGQQVDGFEVGDEVGQFGGVEGGAQVRDVQLGEMHDPYYVNSHWF
ncbi:hypothetical protein GCM10020219_008580 [Nonomuraea dietziae]